MVNLKDILDRVRAEARQAKINYLTRFTTGDRVLFCPMAYVNIIDPVVPIRKKGIFIEPVNEIFCKCIWEGDETPTVCDVMFIKHDKP